MSHLRTTEQAACGGQRVTLSGLSQFPPRPRGRLDVPQSWPRRQIKEENIAMYTAAAWDGYGDHASVIPIERIASPMKRDHRTVQLLAPATVTASVCSFEVPKTPPEFTCRGLLKAVISVASPLCVHMVSNYGHHRGLKPTEGHGHARIQSGCSTDVGSGLSVIAKDFPANSRRPCSSWNQSGWLVPILCCYW